VSYKRFCATEGVEVPGRRSRRLRVREGQYVEITDEDIDNADVELTKTIA